MIGRRRLDPHLDAFIALGAPRRARRATSVIEAPDDGLQAVDFFMDEPSVMGTENALMAAALTPGTTVIRNAACEPHVQDLARMLVRMGAAIEGISLQRHHRPRRRAARRLRAQRVARTTSRSRSFMALAGVTGGELRIKDCVADDLRMIRLAFERLGLHSELDGDDVVVPGEQKLVMSRDHGGYQIKLEDGPWPAFPADLTSASPSRSRPSPRAPS